VSTRESWGINSHTVWCTNRLSGVLQCQLVSGWGLRKWRLALPCGPSGLGMIR